MYADPTLMDLAAAYAKRRNGRKTKHAVACDRPGAKAKFGGHSAFVVWQQYDGSATGSGSGFDTLQQAHDFIKRRKAYIAEHADPSDAKKVSWIISKTISPDGSSQRVETVRYSRPGAKAKMGRAEDIYRKLSSGSVTLANAKEWERLAVEALRLPDFTPTGTDWSLHELAEEIGAEVLALKSRASRPGAKAKMAANDEGKRLLPFLQNALSFASDGDIRMAKKYAKRFVEEATAAGFSRPGVKAKMGKYWVEVNADGKTRTIPVASMNEGLRVLRENATERAVLRHSGEGMNDILANAAAGGVLLTAAGRLHKSVSSRPGAKAKMGLGTYKEGDRTVSVDGRKYEVLPYQVDFFLADLGKQDDAAWRASVVKHYLRKGYIKATASRPGAKAKMGANEDRKRAAGYKWQVRYTKQLGKTEYLGGSPQVIEDTVYFATESAARDWANTMLGKGWFKGMGGSPEKVLTAKVLMFSRPSAKSTHAAATPAMRDIEKKMRELMREADALTAQSLSATISSEKRNEIQDKIERISDMLDVLGEDLGQQRKAAGFAKSTHAALPPQTLEAERKPGGGSHSEAVSRKIATLINEGKPQDQAVAIALDLERRGEL